MLSPCIGREALILKAPCRQCVSASSASVDGAAGSGPQQAERCLPPVSLHLKPDKRPPGDQVCFVQRLRSPKTTFSLRPALA